MDVKFSRFTKEKSNLYKMSFGVWSSMKVSQWYFGFIVLFIFGKKLLSFLGGHVLCLLICRWYYFCLLCYLHFVCLASKLNLWYLDDKQWVTMLTGAWTWGRHRHFVYWAILCEPRGVFNLSNYLLYLQLSWLSFSLSFTNV